MPHDHVNLSDSKKVLLATLRTNQAYEALLDLMEGECVRMETEHFRRGPSCPDSELRASHAECRAARIFLERIQKEIDFFYGEVMGQREMEFLEKNPPKGEDLIDQRIF